MSKFVFSVAKESDEKALRLRMEKDIMPGPVQVSLRRSPNYFSGCSVLGDSSEVAICSEYNSDKYSNNTSSKIIGLGVRSLFKAYINGSEQNHGYLSDLRVDDEYRGGTLLARGYRHLTELHKKNPVPLYDTLILGGNDSARKLLGKARSSLPRYYDMGQIETPLIFLNFDKPSLKESNLRLERGSIKNLPEIIKFYNKYAANKQFAPVIRIEDFFKSRLKALKVDDIFLALRGNDIVGMIALWDQISFRQTHVESYSGVLKYTKHLYDIFSCISPLKPLPKIGAHIPYVYLSLVTIAGNDKGIFAWLLREVYRNAYKRGWHYILPCLHNRDPLVEVLADYRRIDASGNVYIVCFDGEKKSYKNLDNRIPYIELATK